MGEADQKNPLRWCDAQAETYQLIPISAARQMGSGITPDGMLSIDRKVYECRHDQQILSRKNRMKQLLAYEGVAGNGIRY